MSHSVSLPNDQSVRWGGVGPSWPIAPDDGFDVAKGVHDAG
jgi:hypothetical protein